MTDQRIFLHVECSGRTFRSFQNDSTSNLVVESDLLFLRGFYGQFFSFPLFFLSFLFPSFPFPWSHDDQRRDLSKWTGAARYYSESARLKRSLDHGCQHVPRFFLTGGNRFFSFCVPSCDNDQWSLELEQQRRSGDLARASSARLNPKIRNGDTSGELSIVSFFFPSPSSPLRTRGHRANPAHVSFPPPPPPSS